MAKKDQIHRVLIEKRRAEVAELHYEQGVMKQREIAERIGVSRATVSRDLKVIRERIGIKDSAEDCSTFEELALWLLGQIDKYAARVGEERAQHILPTILDRLIDEGDYFLLAALYRVVYRADESEVYKRLMKMADKRGHSLEMVFEQTYGPWHRALFVDDEG